MNSLSLSNQNTRSVVCSVVRRQGGFTMVELLVVMIVVGVLMVAVVGGLGGKEGRAEKVGLQAMAGVMESARLRAISRGQYVAAVFPDGSTGAEDRRFSGGVVVELTVEEGSANQQFSEGLVVGNFEKLPLGKVLIGQAQGASSVIDGERVPVQWRAGGPEESLPAVVFTPTGAILTPSSKPQLVVRIADGDVDGTQVALRGDFEERKYGRIEVQRVTGKLIIVE